MDAGKLPTARIVLLSVSPGQLPLKRSTLTEKSVFDAVIVLLESAPEATAPLTVQTDWVVFLAPVNRN
jgi:hypothetical protein